MKMDLSALGLLPLLAMTATPATAGDGTPGVLRAEFVYRSELAQHPIATRCPHGGVLALGGVTTDVVVGLAGQLVESVIDAAAAKTQAQSTTLEATVPLDGFYDNQSKMAVHDGCLVIHNGTLDDGTDASLLGLFQLKSSSDATAFRFDVIEWRYKRFLREKTGQWFQSGSQRDVALKIEFLTPGSAGLGTRATFVEHLFPAVDVATLKRLFVPEQQLPWFAAPPKANGGSAARNLPLNIRVTVIETTRPNQFATWLQQTAKDKKADISNLVKDSVHKALDASYEATESAKLAETAGTAYAAYKAAWDELTTLKATKPTPPAAPATPAQTAAYNAALSAWKSGFLVKTQAVQAKKVLARAAFGSADLPWPGDLPAVVED